jgi:hypothetical protein
MILSKKIITIKIWLQIRIDYLLDHLLILQIIKILKNNQIQTQIQIQMQIIFNFNFSKFLLCLKSKMNF